MKRFALRKAFTIVEMVIVIAVIAILATVLVPTISGVINKANLSADQQFVASLNIQLKLWELDNHTISSEADLQKAINHYYNDDLPGFYESLKPKSANQRFHFWFDVQNGMVVVGTYEMLTDINGDGFIPTNVDTISRTFSPASPRNLILYTDDGPKQYFLMDQEGSELADMIAGMENLAKDEEGQDYEELITDLAERSADENNDEKELYAAIAEKISKTTIVTNSCAYRYNSLDDIKYVWIVPSAGMLTEAEVFVYDGTEVNDGTSGAALSSNVKDIELPDRVYVGVGGLNVGSLVSDLDDNNNNGTENYSNSVRLHVNTTEISELQKIYATDCVLVTPSGARYVWVGDKLYPLPIQMNDGTPTTTPVGSVDSGSMQIDQIKIECSDAVAPNPNEGKVYLSNGILYAAYDKGTVQLALSGGLSNSMVTWTSNNQEVATVDSTGKVTLKLPAVEQGATYKATITAAYNYDETNTASIEVFVVRPVSVALTLGGQSLSIPATNHAVTLTYTDNTEFKVGETVSVEYSQGGYVRVDGVVSYSTSGEMFTVDANTGTVTVDPAKITSDPQTLTVTYKNGDTTYLTQDFVVTVVDNSASSFKVNDITDTVEMGATYLFRVGNGNTFTLDKLFNSDKPGDNITLKIYDASKTSGEGGNGPIASDSGFWAKVNNTAPTYEEVDEKQVYKGWTLTKDTWAASTIQFGGTGVAIIEITTPKGTAKLAVEVVNGKNVTAAGDFSGATNYVLLNNIIWGTANKTAISGTLYGNGFAINATTFTSAVTDSNNALFYLNGGTIDNLVINGPVYPELIYQSEVSSSKPYYVMGVYTTEDATITNSYISGFRSPVMANGTSLYLENTTLVGGNYANLWLQTGTLTLKNVTTVQTTTQATIGSGKVLGVGIVVNSGVSASNVTIIGELTQYNWASESDAGNMDSDIKSFVSTIFSNDTLTHNVGGTDYINSGILFLGNSGTVNNAEQTNKSYYESTPASGTFMGSTVSANVYTHTTTNGTISAVPAYGGYTPNTQAVLKPTFKHNLTLTNGEVLYSIDITNGATCILDASVYTASKYTGQTVTVTITCTGGTVSGEKITFSKAGTYTVTYTVEDNAFYKADGSKQTTSRTDTYKVTVVVSNSNHKSATINVGTFTTDPKWVTTYEDGIWDLNYQAWYEVLSGISITDYDENGNEVSVSISPTNLNGLTIKSNDSEVTGVSIDGDKYWMYDIKSDDNQSDKSIIFTYTYKGLNGKTATATKNFTLNKPSTCVTPDTLVTLADGTQKRIDELTYDDQLLVWNFYEGEYEIVPASAIGNHGVIEQTVTTLYFEDGTEINIVGEHGFYDADLGEFVFLNAENAKDYVGHNFIREGECGLVTVKMVDYHSETQVTDSYSILSDKHYNCFLEGMLTLPTTEGLGNFYMPFDVTEDMAYDKVQMWADVESYGLYTYADFADIMTEDEFVALNAQYFKVAVGKGIITYDDLVYFLEKMIAFKNGLWK